MCLFPHSAVAMAVHTGEKSIVSAPTWEHVQRLTHLDKTPGTSGLRCGKKEG